MRLPWAILALGSAPQAMATTGFVAPGRVPPGALRGAAPLRATAPQSRGEPAAQATASSAWLCSLLPLGALALGLRRPRRAARSRPTVHAVEPQVPAGTPVVEPLPVLKRPRRNRRSPAMREMFAETSLSAANLVLPIFVQEPRRRWPRGR